MNGCSKPCCRGHALSPMFRQYLGGVLIGGRTHLKKFLSDADDVKKGNTRDLIERAGSVCAKLFADEAWRKSDVGIATFGKGANITMGLDPTQAFAHPNNQIRCV
jgi:hypothetical protein